MKTMTCRQLGGACDLEFQANSFEEISEMSKRHGMEMCQKNDESHLEAMTKMRKMMISSDSDAMKNWMKSKKEEFNALPNID